MLILNLSGQLMNSVNIFIDNKRVVITSARNKNHFESHSESLLHCHYTEAKKIPELFNKLVSTENFEILLITGPKTQAEQAFAKHFTIIEAAGGVIQNYKKEILFIYRNGKWDLPKGKIDKNESLRKAAVRECEEECAVQDLEVINKITVTFHMYPAKDGKYVLKKTHWFAMNSSYTGKLIPQEEEGITQAAWTKKTDLKKVMQNTYPAIKTLLQAGGYLKTDAS
jgi:ADP-ribose pyrophosphatase YjhB (NUDIX family)